MTIDRVSGAALLLLGAIVAWEDRVLPLGTQSTPGPGYLPMLLSFFLAILGIILIIRGRQSLLFHSVRWTEGVHALGIIGCCVFATLALERLGYRATIAIALGFLFGILERLKWWLVLSLALSLSFGSFWIFATVLKIMLPRGGWGF